MSEIVAEMIGTKDVPQSLFDVFTPIVNESRIHFHQNGISMQAVDPANVAMAFAELDADAWDSWETPGSVTIGANLTAFEDRIDVADSDQLVQLAVDMEVMKTHITIDNIDQSVAMIDPDAIRKEPDTPDLDLPNTLVVNGDQLETAVDVIEMVADYVFIRGDPDGERVVFVGEGDTDRSEVTYGNDSALEGTKVADATETLLSLEYFTELVDSIPSDAEVTIQFGDEFPIIMDWQTLDGRLDVTQMMAPRIQSD